MKPTALLDNIRNQPASLARVAAYQFGAGQSDLQEAASAIREAGNVVFCGMGGSLFAAIPAAYYLEAHGIEARFVEASEVLHFGLARARPTAMVLVSRSGETVEISKLLPVLADLNVTTIGLTNMRGSRLAREARHPMYLNSESDRMVAVQTYTGMMAALLLLAGAVLEEPGDRWRAALLHAEDALANATDEALAASEEWNEFLVDARVVYLLGRGPSLASVHEGALLFNEASRTSSAALSAAQFRHGPVEVVDERFRGIVFASQPGTQNVDLALASDLISMGGKVRVCQARGVSSPLEPLVEIVPVQVAACRLADAKGIDPGDFRYASLVTLAEAGFDAL